MVIFFVIVWIIWMEWNDRCFDKFKEEVNEFVDLVFSRFGWWIKGWSDDFFDSFDDVRRNLLCLRFKKYIFIFKLILKEEVEWEVFKRGGLK